LNAHLRRTFYFFVAGFVSLVGVLAYWQVYVQESLANDPSNSLQSQRVQSVPRGLILAGDGETELARSEEQDSGTYERIYPEGPLYAGITGYWSTRYGASGIEIGENNNLSGNGEPETLDELLNQISDGPQAGNDVELTLDPELQRAAYDGLAASSTGRGAAVALDPKNGEILALVSYPSYDPNNIDDNFSDLIENPDNPLYNRATQGLYPPGSTFKVITAAAALKSGVSPSDEFKDDGIYETPGYDVYNYKARSYGEVTFEEAIAKSINTIFARVAYEYVGNQTLSETAYDFGFGDDYEDFPLPVAPSSLGNVAPDQWVQGDIAQISFGQGSVTSNVFEMAQVTGAIANGGTMMNPRLVREVRSPDGVILDQPSSSVRENVLGEETANTLSDMMESVVEDAETTAKIPGIKVAAKTGTAENSTGDPHSWFISFAPADDPEIAVAVIVENGNEGYKQALPIARRMMETYLRSKGELPDESATSGSASGGGSTTPQPQGGTTVPASQPAPQQPQNVNPSQPFRAPSQSPGRAPTQPPNQAAPGQQPQSPGQAPGQQPQTPGQPPGQPPVQRPGG
jgi:peptidoglycan glycosyltransferase